MNLQRLLDRPLEIESASQAERLAREINDVSSQATAANMIGLILERGGDLDAARPHYAEAAALAQSIGSTRGEAMFLANEGVNYGRTGDSEQAIVRFSGPASSRSGRITRVSKRAC